MKEGKGDSTMPSKLSDMGKQFKEMYERHGCLKDGFWKMNGYGINSLTNDDSNVNSLYVDIHNVIDNESNRVSVIVTSSINIKYLIYLVCYLICLSAM